MGLQLILSRLLYLERIWAEMPVNFEVDHKVVVRVAGMLGQSQKHQKGHQEDHVIFVLFIVLAMLIKLQVIHQKGSRNFEQ